MKMLRLEGIFFTSLLYLLLAATASGLANCPPGCQCDDNTLVVQCGEGQLDVLPIALNPSIQRLVIRNNKIKTIDSSIQFYAELTFLDLSSNHLMTIPQRTFAYQKKLQEVHLNDNKIGAISNKTLIGLSAVTVLNLRGNLISELHLGTFTPLVKIEELNLGKNRIGFVDPKAFDGLSQLRILYLDDNALTSVPDPVIFQSMPSLAELFLGMNTLLTVPAAAFQDVPALTRLDLRGAGLRNISHDSFKGLEALRQLDLSDNRLTRVPTFSLSHLVRLEELTLGQNDFEVIVEGAFVGLKQLKRLDISGALRLKRIMNGAFSTNGNLEYLNLSSNKMLHEVQEGALSGLPNMRHVILKANALTSLAEGLFPWRDLITLDLSENPISCDCRVMWLRNLLVEKNGTNDAVSEVYCAFPDRLHGEALRNLNPTLMGCSHTDPRKQALIGALLVGSAATLTALALILYRCRRKIRDYINSGVWGNSALGRKEREYQKTFCDEDYITRHQHHPCSLGIHSTFSNTYTPHHPAARHYGFCTMPINDLNAPDAQKNLQQLQVPTASVLNEKKALQTGVNIDDCVPYSLRIKPSNGSATEPQQSVNHYTKPQFAHSAVTLDVGEPCYSYADVPMMHSPGVNACEARQHQLRLTQEHFNQQQQQQLKQQQQSLHYGTSARSECDASSDVMDANYIYSNTHYSMPLEQARNAKTPTPPPLPPALPLRNGLATSGRRSFMGGNAHKQQLQQSQPQQQQQNSNTMRNPH
ncbi:leucine-rich repeats and immunoglobulin-like domains protein 1 [Anastrepha ludens]|uniref:leucine-rich repeats and immunoglobulin-like domains protein 1 n=1 Tax=Anastrepha ludens TaxID=28586 RepID=UPI0023B099F3|nr:leucine-rich repeats and immunoglobulin-like domains protein 1 [Anastrepha ludens]